MVETVYRNSRIVEKDFDTGAIVSDPGNLSLAGSLNPLGARAKTVLCELFSVV